ncbi:MAG TPA: tetratricopeptide repeat protein [Mucilaginibacter sp.]|nr:tetratricopeptide repeat protein [Mucilaginibacter sp.]
MKKSMISTVIFCMTAIIGLGQNKGADGAEGVYKQSLYITQIYSCNTELNTMERNGIISGKRDPDALIAKANECLSVGPSSVAYEIRAKAYLEKGNFTKALADYELTLKCAKGEMDSTETLNKQLGGKIFAKQIEHSVEFIANVYEQRASVYMLKGDRENAVKDLQASLKLYLSGYSARTTLDNINAKIVEKQRERRMAHPVSADDYVLIADHKYLLAKYDDAIAAYDKAISLDAKNAAAYAGRGKTRGVTKMPDAALEDFDRAISLAPKNADAYAGKAYISMNKKDWKTAIRNFTDAIKFDPKNVGLVVSRGTAYAGDLQYNAALKDYDNALAASKTDEKYNIISAWTSKGDVYRQTGKNDEALDAYNKAVDAGKGNYLSSIYLSETYVSRGKLYASMGKNDLAAADFNATLKAIPGHAEAKAELAKLQPAANESTTPKTAEAWSLLGRQQFRERNYEGAVNSFSQSIRLEPNTAYYYALRGAAQIAKNDENAFRADFDTALRLSPKDTSILFIRGMMLLSKGKKDEAVTDFRKILEIDPGNKAAKEKLQQLGL